MLPFLLIDIEQHRLSCAKTLESIESGNIFKCNSA